MTKADFFISHASEDKDSLVRELANNLMLNGSLVFYDEYSIKLGDSLSESINRGISNSNHAIIILSKYFFEKGWTNAELQALFNKSIREKFKLLIIYHGVNHADVSEKYPLLADIKGIDSSVGIEKISQDLLAAIEKKGQLSYLKHDYARDDAGKSGFSISMYVGFPNFANQPYDKVLFDLGNKGIFHSRLRLIYVNNRIYFEVIDEKYHKMSVSVDVSNWELGEQKFIHADLDVGQNQIYLFLENRIVDKLSFNELSIGNHFLKSATGIIGNSLELMNPCQFIIGTHSIGQSMTEEMVLNFSKIIEEYMNALKK
jgi:hypothetical protein